MALKRKKDNGIAKYFIRQFNIDIEATYERLKDVAKVPVDKITDKHVLMRLVNRASKDAVDANIIANCAVEQRNLQKFDMLVLMKELKSKAMKRCRDQLEIDGIQKKQITKDMIEEEIASGPDTGPQYREMLEQVEELKKVRNILLEFAKQWNNRVSSLQSQLRALGATREVVFGNGKED